MKALRARWRKIKDRYQLLRLRLRERWANWSLTAAELLLNRMVAPVHDRLVDYIYARRVDQEGHYLIFPSIFPSDDEWHDR